MATHKRESHTRPVPSASRAVAAMPSSRTTAPAHPLLRLQSLIGNRAVGRLIQAKLTVNPAGDQYEQEADRVAKQTVQQMPASPSPSVGYTQPSSDGIEATPEVEATIHQAHGSGQAIPASIRARLEQSLGADFRGVRVHADARADHLNRALQARAFTTGHDIFFRQGEYNPSDSGGREVLAHELTHVVQQNGSATAPVVQRDGGAGTKPRTFSTDGRYLIKLTSKREKFVYEQREDLGIGGILPAYYPVNDYVEANGKITSVSVGGLEDPIALKDPLTPPSDNQEILVISTVGHEEGAKSEKVIMDIKIGAYTKSETQFGAEGANWFLQRFKQLEHDFKDWQKGNRETGFSILAGQGDYDRERKGRARDLGEAIQVVLDDLAAIQKTMTRAIDVITFVGSSVLCVFNLDHPGRSVAKLIDPDHPILTGELSEEGESNVPREILTPNRIYRGRVREEMDKRPPVGSWQFGGPAIAIRSGGSSPTREEQQNARKGTQEYLDKYKRNYLNGLQGLIAHFKSEYQTLTGEQWKPSSQEEIVFI
jgi:Domain of unknown function (DUF4157)